MKITRITEARLVFAGSLVMVCCIFAVAYAAADNAAPKPAITVPCEVIEWHDGDTGTVRITLDVRVRLLDCWAPEVIARKLTEAEKKLPKPQQQAIAKAIQSEKQRGLDSTASLNAIAPVGAKGMLEVPLDGAERVDDVFTFGRLLGRVWFDGKNVSALQVQSGHATATK